MEQAAIDWYAITTIIAVFLGPIMAVIITRIIDDKRADTARKFDIFRTLMRTRKMPISADHVGALNLVEVEFIKNEKVITAWKAYFEHLGRPYPQEKSQEERDRFTKGQDELLVKLLSQIAKALKVDIEQLDILRGSYVPQGWATDDAEQRAVRQGLVQVLSGNAAIPIRAHLGPSQPGSLFPPAPDR